MEGKSLAFPEFLAEIQSMYAVSEKDKQLPLIENATQLQQKLRTQLDLPIALGMRYKKPTIARALQQLSDQEVKDILVVPLFPQYTMSTTWTAIEKVKEIQFQSFKNLNLTFLNSFYNHPDFIQALSAEIKKNHPENYDQILFSFPNISKSHDQLVQKRAKTQKDVQLKTYEEQCLETTELVRNQLNSSTPIDCSFLTIGHEKSGLKPDTLERLSQFPQHQLKKILVVNPGAVLDSALALGKINQKGKSIFLKNGGEKLTYIKCLNDADAWVSILVKWIQGWASIKNEL